MSRTRSVLALCAALALALADMGRAHAQEKPRTDPDRAQALFDQAMKLMDARDFAPACPLLAQSDELDPGMGTRFRLAECYEKIGRLASAWTLFNDVAVAAKLAGSRDRERVARQRAAALDPRLSRVTLQIPPEVAGLLGLEVRFGGERLPSDRWGTPLPAAPGEHTAEITAPGKKPWKQAVRVERPGQAVTLDVPMLEDAPAEAPPNAAPPAGTRGDERGSGGIDWTPRRIAAASAAGVGVAGVVVGATFGAIAASQWSDARDTCRRDDPARCTPAGVALAEDASTSATISTVAFLVSAAGLGAGAILWHTALTAPTAPEGDPAEPGESGAAAARRVWIAPAVGPSGAGGVIRVRF